MSAISVLNLQGTSDTVPEEAIEELRGTLRGDICLPGEEGYEAARTLWNAMIDRHPDLVVRARGPQDVLRAVRFARAHDLLVSVRSGGHNIAGKAVADGGLLIDLSQMRGVRVDPARRTAWVEAGCLLSDVDAETQAHGLVVPLGINSTTGISGLTLGGGFGWTSRKFGLAVDNLISADVVTADGRMIRASESENPDLFWGIRGGGGNFGIVTGFEFRLHSLGPEVTSGLIVHPFDRAKEILTAWRDFTATAPTDLSAWVVLRKAPPLPFLPPEWHGREVVVLAACHAGSLAEGEAALAPLRAVGDPIADVIGPHPFVGWQAAFDPLLTPGARNYWKSHDFAEMSDATLDVLADFSGRLPSDECEIFVGHLGGAIGKVPSDATAFGSRKAQYVMNVHTRWQDSSMDRRCIDWARDFFDATASMALPSVYVNFLPEDETGKLGSVYGPNFDRLTDLKTKWDPDNFFRVNQNILPRPA